MGWMPILRPSRVIALPTFHPFPSVLFFPSLLKFSKEVWGSTVSFPQSPANHDSQLQSWMERNTLGPHDLQSWTARVARVP